MNTSRVGIRWHIVCALLLNFFASIASIAWASITPSAPVIFVHGLNSSGATWSKMATALSDGSSLGYRLRHTPNAGLMSCDVTSDWLSQQPTSWINLPSNFTTQYKYFAIDFSDNNSLTFGEQGSELKTVIDCVKRMTETSSVILVAHSMGGIASRYYMQGKLSTGSSQAFVDDIQILINIGTPNKGAPYTLPQVSHIPEQFFSGLPLAPFYLLAKDSEGITGMADGTLPINGIQYISLRGHQRTYFPWNLVTLFELGIGDGVVSTQSQSLLHSLGPPPSGINHTQSDFDIWRPISGEWCGPFFPYILAHICEVNDIEIILQVGRIIDPTASTIPISITGEATALSPSSVTLNSSYRVWGVPSFVVGIQWNVNGGGDEEATKSIVAGSASGDNYKTLTAGLQAGAIVRYKSFVELGSGRIYGSERAVTIPATSGLLAAPIGLAPTGDNFPSVPALTWGSVENASSYRIYMARSPTDLPSSAQSNDCAPCTLVANVVGTAFRASSEQVAPGVLYYWRVKAQTVDRNGQLSEISNFSVLLNQNLSPPVLTSPSDGAILSVSDPLQLSWSSVAGASSYRLLIARSAAALQLQPSDSDCLGACFLNMTLATTSLPLVATELVPGDTYYWAVKARSVTQYGALSSVRHFTYRPITCAYLLSPPASVQYPLVSPAAGGIATISVITQPGCTASVSGLPAWVQPLSNPVTAGANGIATMSLIAAPNTSPSSAARFTTFLLGGVTGNLSQFGLAPATSYSVTVSTGVGGSVVPSGTTTVGANQLFSVTATPASPAYQFSAWNENGSPVSNNSTYSFVVASNRTLTAQFTAGTIEQDVVLSGADADARWRIFPGPVGTETDGWFKSGEKVSLPPGSNYTVWCSDTPYFAPAQPSQVFGLGANYAGPWVCNYSAKPGGAKLSLPIREQSQIDVGYCNYLARSADLRVLVWGLGIAGAPGNGQAINQVESISNLLVPQFVPNLSGVSSVGSTSNCGLLLAKQSAGWAGWGGWSGATATVESLSSITRTKNDLAVSSGGTGWTVSQNARLDPLGGVDGAVDLVGSGGDLYALRGDGAVYAVKASSAVGLGIDFDNPSVAVAPRGLPALLPSLKRIVSISSASGMAYAVKSDGTVWVWGPTCCTPGTGSGYGGAVRPPSTYRPVQVPGIVDAKAVYTNNSNAVYVLLNSGKVLAWGANEKGQLGRGTLSTEEATPTEVPGLTNVGDLATTDRAVLVQTLDGSVWSWGGNSASTPGNGLTVTAQTTPVQVLCPAGYTGFLSLNDVSTCVPRATTTLSVNPIGSASGVTLKVNGNPVSYPYSASLSAGAGVLLEAEYAAGYSVSSWRSADAKFASRLLSLSTGVDRSLGLLVARCDETLHLARAGIPLDYNLWSFDVAGAGEALSLDVRENPTASGRQNCRWDFSTDVDWLHPVSGSGYGAGAFALQVDQNPETTPRSATFSIAVPGVSHTYAINQAAGPTRATPDLIAYPSVIGAPAATIVQSLPATVSGLNVSAPISIAGGAYSIGCTGVYTTESGTVTDGQSLCVEVQSSPIYEVTSSATLDIGGAQSTFEVTVGAPQETVFGDGFEQP